MRLVGRFRSRRIEEGFHLGRDEFEALELPSAVMVVARLITPAQAALSGLIKVDDPESGVPSTMLDTRSRIRRSVRQNRAQNRDRLPPVPRAMPGNAPRHSWQSRQPRLHRSPNLLMARGIRGFPLSSGTIKLIS